jgi:hypothetical protein
MAGTETSVFITFADTIFSRVEGLPLVEARWVDRWLLPCSGWLMLPPRFSRLIFLVLALPVLEVLFERFKFRSSSVIGHPIYRCKVFWLSALRAKANSINRSISAGKGTPQTSHSLGYMLIVVNPGMVFSSFK